MVSLRDDDSPTRGADKVDWRPDRGEVFLAKNACRGQAFYDLPAP
jgi:hypothetical protein